MRIILREHWWIALVVVFYGMIYACSLTFTYIDPDDAVSMEYHILGRDLSVQQPFERFQSAMDTLLSLLPPQEPVVRVWAMIATSLAAVLLVILMLILCLDIAEVQAGWLKSIAGLALLGAAPELSYLGLLYTPMLVGMCCAVGAHLLLRSALRRGSSQVWKAPWRDAGILMSGALLGLGGVFRWDILAYGVIIALDVFREDAGSRGVDPVTFGRRFTVLSTVAASAFLLWLGLQLLTNDLSKAIPEMFAAAEETRGETQVGDIRVYGALAMLFTPAFVWAALAGAWRMVRQRGRAMWFVLMLVLFAAVWPFWSTSKEMLVFVPAFTMLFVHGLVRLWHLDRRTMSARLTRLVFAAVLVLPWVFGIRMTYGDSSWGPGFELAPFSHPVNEGIRNLSIVAGAGAAFPTNEGVRPLFGHARVLLSGSWRDMAVSHHEEIRRALAVAIDRSMPVLVGMHYDAFVMNSAVRSGYMTKDPEMRGVYRQPVLRRLWSESGDTLLLFRQPLAALVRDSTSVVQILGAQSASRVMCWSEPGKMRFLYRLAPDALEELGPRTAILDLHRLLEAIPTQSRQ